jgi:hypothetical protein
MRSPCGNIQLMFFHSRATAQYPELVRRLTGTAATGPWERTVECSDCKESRDRLTSRTVTSSVGN